MNKSNRIMKWNDMNMNLDISWNRGIMNAMGYTDHAW
jgi:hypothetical protein